MDCDKHIEQIKKVSDSIKPGVVTILTGKNGSGKSLIRKLIASYIAEKLNLDKNKPCAASISMESRTQRKHEFLALCAIGIDEPDNPTSYETLHNIDSLIQSSCKIESPRYLIIDEPEIGMGEEMVASLLIRLNNSFNPLPEGCLGVLIITHNRYLVEHLIGDFANIEDMTRQEWLNRKIIPTDIEEYKENAMKLNREIYKRTKQ